jgi:hypothetical protein
LYNLKDINDNYSFYYKDYLNLSTKILLVDKYIKINNIFNIYDYNKLEQHEIENIKQDVIILNKNFIKICKLNNHDNYSNCYILYQINQYPNLVYTYYLENLIKKNIDNFIKGKNNDIDKIKEINILNLSINIQNTINNYIETSNKLIHSNNENINMYNSLKTSILENISVDNMIVLEEIVELIYDKNKDICISIIKNSLSAGDISLYKGELNNNSYYLVIKNNNFILEYIYYYLKYKEPLIKEMTKLTQQYNLIKSKLFNIKIPNIDIKFQKEIIKHCIDFDDNIKLLESNNNLIKNKDIFDIVLKINNL